MRRSIFRIALTTMALVMLFAGSLNLNRTGANKSTGSLCAEHCACVGGPYTCCIFLLPDGTKIVCGMAGPIDN